MFGARPLLVSKAAHNSVTLGNIKHLGFLTACCFGILEYELCYFWILGWRISNLLGKRGIEGWSFNTLRMFFTCLIASLPKLEIAQTKR